MLVWFKTGTLESCGRFHFRFRWPERGTIPREVSSKRRAWLYTWAGAPRSLVDLRLEGPIYTKSIVDDSGDGVTPLQITELQIDRLDKFFELLKS